MKKIAILAQCILLVTLAVAPVSADLGGAERFVYDVSWTGIKAGIAVQEVTTKGDDIRIVNTIRSSGLVSAFFSIDDRTESILSRRGAQAGSPRFFVENIKEGKFQTHKETRFDFSSLTARGTDFLTRTEIADPITLRTYDSLSSIYYIRSCPLEPSQTIFFDIYDFKHLWKTQVQVVRRERIRTSLGTFNTVMVTSQLKSNRIDAKAGNTTFWFTDDSRHIPVKIATKLKIGEVTLTLVGGSYGGA